MEPGSKPEVHTSLKSFYPSCALKPANVSTDPNRSELLRWTKMGILKPHIEPRFDTLVLDDQHCITEHRAFVIPIGAQDRCKSDTNMDLGSYLGVPLMAVWSYLRVHFERYDHLEDALEWKECASIELIKGLNNVFWRGTLGSMDPILPKGGYKKINRMIKTGIVKFWPWYQGDLHPTVIGSTNMFQISVQYKRAFKPRSPMRIKISLGPWLYRP